MKNKAIVKSTFLKFVKGLYKDLPLYVVMCLFGVMCAAWPDLWKNETANTLTAFSLFISIIALFISNYFIVEKAIESRTNNKKRLFSDYCARFSSNQNLCIVAEWLLTISEIENGVIKVYPNRMNNCKSRAITEPTYFEQKCFLNFFIELNIQIKNKQLEKEDVRKIFSLYALIFKEVLLAENMEKFYMLNLSDLSELL